MAIGLPLLVQAKGAEGGYHEISVPNPTDRYESYILDFDRWGYVDFFYTNENGKPIHLRTGELVHPSQRQFTFDNAVVLQVEVPPHSTLQGRVLLEKGIYGGPLPLEALRHVHPKDTAISNLWESRIFSLIVEAILLFIFVYNLGLYLTTRLKHYRFYLVMMVIMSLETAREAGFIGLYIPERFWTEQLQWHMAMVLNFFLCLLAPYLVRNLANLDQHFPRTRLLFQVYPHPAIGLLLLSAIDPELGFFAFNVSIPFVFVLMFAIMLVNMVRRNPNSTLLFIGSGAMIIGSILHWLGMSGQVDLNDGVFTIFRSIGTIVFDTTMSFLLGKMMLDLKKENEVQQSQLIRNLRVERRNQQRVAVAEAEAREREREAIARRLHDDLQNELVTLHFGLMNLEEEVRPEGKEAHREISGLVKASIQKVRHIAHEFMPPNLSGTGGLENALSDLANRVRAMGSAVSLHHSGALDLNLTLRAFVYRTVQELLSNALKHSGADHIAIHLRHSGNLLSVTVEDNGVGFREEEPELGKGLETLRMNLMGRGGELEMDRGILGGARIRFSIPMGED